MWVLRQLLKRGQPEAGDTRKATGNVHPVDASAFGIKMPDADPEGAGQPVYNEDGVAHNDRRWLGNDSRSEPFGQLLEIEPELFAFECHPVEIDFGWRKLDRFLGLEQHSGSRFVLLSLAVYGHTCLVPRSDQRAPYETAP